MRTGRMTEIEAARRVDDAIEHLRAFAASLDAHVIVDRASRLTAADLKIVVEVFDDVLDKEHGVSKKNDHQL
jgi:hypothetical protein